VGRSTEAGSASPPPALTLVADAAPHVHGSATAKLLTDVVDLAAITLEALERRTLMRERLRTLAHRVESRADTA